MALRSPHACIKLRSVRPVTKADVAAVIDTLRHSGVFPPEADLKPETAGGGGISIFTKHPKYKSVRFTNSHGWPVIDGTESMDEWAGDHTCVATWYHHGSVLRRNSGSDETLVCKAGIGADPWTYTELMKVVEALGQCGAFKLQRRNSRVAFVRY